MKTSTLTGCSPLLGSNMWPLHQQGKFNIQSYPSPQIFTPAVRFLDYKQPEKQITNPPLQDTKNNKNNIQNNWIMQQKKKQRQQHYQILNNLLLQNKQRKEN